MARRPAIAQLGNLVLLPARDGSDFKKGMAMFGKRSTAHAARSRYFGCAFDVGGEAKPGVDPIANEMRGTKRDRMVDRRIRCPDGDPR
jgi:hypothetical protein